MGLDQLIQSHFVLKPHHCKESICKKLKKY